MQRFVGLDGLRGVAALCVMGYHVTQGGLNLFPTAPAAVDLFFALSGFVIARTYEPRLAAGLSPLRFLTLRVIRLYPLYAIGTLLGGIVLALLTASGELHWAWPSALAAVLLALAFLPAVNAPHQTLYPLDGPAWSLAFELIANAGFAWRRVGTRTLASICLLTAPVYAAAVWVGHGPGGWEWSNAAAGVPRVVFAFTLGVLLNRLHSGTARVVPRLPYGVLPFIVVTALALGPPSLGPAYFLLVVLCLFPAVLFTAVHMEPHPAMRAFWSWLGWISYAVYAIHQPVLETTYYLLHRVHDARAASLPWPWALAAAATTVALAHALTRYVDAPLRHWLGRIATRRAGAALPAGSLARS